MAPTTEEIVDRYHQRRKNLDPRIAKMVELRDAYKGDIVVPLPELDKSEKPMVANLIAQGLDQTAMRIASTLPNVVCPAMHPGFEASEQRAAKRREAILSWWSMNRLNLVQRKRARWLVGYASAPVIIRPDTRRRIPLWQERDPLTALPPPGFDLTPLDCIFSFKRTYRWLREHFPESANALYRGPRNQPVNPDQEFTVVEYADSEVLVLAAIGATRDHTSPLGNGHGTAPGGDGRPFVQLGERVPNRIGRCPVVFPGRISLDSPQGQFDGLIGLYWWQSKLMALEGIAVERSIFPNEWLIPHPGQNAQVVTAADGIQGIIGEVAGGTISTNNLQPGVQTYPTMDRIERAMRLSGGIPAEYGGESTSNIRTGRRGQAVLSAAVDFPIQEAQETLAASLEEENLRAIAISKEYFGSEKRSFYYSWNGKKGRGAYTPDEVFETDEHTVVYSFPGADINQLIIGTGQRIGMGTMSKRRGMELDPLIDDPEMEENRVIAEGLHQAFVSGLQSKIADGTIPPNDAARIVELVMKKGRTLFDAVLQAQKEAQARQAAAGPPGTPEGPVDPMAPEAQPGLAAPGAGAEAGVAIPEGDATMPAMGNLAQLLGNLRRPAMTLSSE